MQEFQELRVQLAKARLVQGTVYSLGARAETRDDVLQVPLYTAGGGKVSLSRIYRAPCLPTNTGSCVRCLTCANTRSA